MPDEKFYTPRKPTVSGWWIALMLEVPPPSITHGGEVVTVQTVWEENASHPKTGRTLGVLRNDLVEHGSEAEALRAIMANKRKAA